MAQERRQAHRVSFSEDDGVSGVLIKVEASGITLILPTLDVSKTGSKFLSDADGRLTSSSLRGCAHPGPRPQSPLCR
jgi:hypothetical protein